MPHSNPYNPVLVAEIEIPLFNLIHLRQHTTTLIFSHRSETKDPQTHVAGVSSVHHPERERENERKREGEDKAAILKYMVTLHAFFICQQLFS